MDLGITNLQQLFMIHRTLKKLIYNVGFLIVGRTLDGLVNHLEQQYRANGL